MLLITLITADGKPRMLTFSMNFSHLVYTLLAILGGFALAAMKVLDVASSILQFFLTSPEPVLLRFFALTLAVLVVLVVVQWMKYRSAIARKAAGVSC